MERCLRDIEEEKKTRPNVTCVTRIICIVITVRKFSGDPICERNHACASKIPAVIVRSRNEAHLHDSIGASGFVDRDPTRRFGMRALVSSFIVFTAAPRERARAPDIRLFVLVVTHGTRSFAAYGLHTRPSPVLFSSRSRERGFATPRDQVHSHFLAQFTPVREFRISSRRLESD